MKRVRKAMRHAWFALRHGDWSCGWERRPGDPWLGVHHFRYDGDHCYARIGWFWFGVSY